jgi:hypothetical protein
VCAWCGVRLQMPDLRSIVRTAAEEYHYARDRTGITQSAFQATAQVRKKVSTDTAGGCYAAGGNVRLHWNRLTKKAQTLTDSEVLREFVRTLRNHTILRHHIAGDIGKA